MHEDGSRGRFFDVSSSGPPLTLLRTLKKDVMLGYAPTLMLGMRRLSSLSAAVTSDLKELERQCDCYYS